MIDLKKVQREVLENKISKGFNTTDIYLEFGLVYEELSEAMAAYRKKLPDLGEELADVVIYLLGLAEILNVNLEDEIIQKVEKNKSRKYEKIDGVLVRVED